ncbi:MAG: MauE/DoxX family redox-associated membrane protein [Chitinophagaceae bacterium]
MFLYIMVALYVIAGINHFVNPVPYKEIIPLQLPSPLILVYVSGALEIILGISLIFTGTRRIAAWGIILLLIAVFPANIQMMINYHHQNNPNLWIAILRLPLQILLIYWAYLYTGETKKSPNLNL